MLLTIHNLPANMRYNDVKDLLKDKCGLTDLILDKLTKEGENAKKVTVGVSDDGDAAILVRKINGLYLGNQQLYVEDARKKPASEQPFRTSSSHTSSIIQPPALRMNVNQTPYAEDIITRFSSENQQRYVNTNQKRYPNESQTRYNNDQTSQMGGGNVQSNYALNMPMPAAATYPATDPQVNAAAMYALQQQQMMANYQMMGYYVPTVPDQNFVGYAAGNQAVASNMSQDVPQNTDWPVQSSGNVWEEAPMEIDREYRGRNQSGHRSQARRSRSPVAPNDDRRFDFGNRYEPANNREDRPVDSGRPSRFHDHDADLGNARGGFDRNEPRHRSPPRKMTRFDRDNKTDFLLPPGHNSGPRPAFGKNNHRDDTSRPRGPGRDEAFGPRGPNRDESFGPRGPNRDESFGPRGPNRDESFGPRGPNRNESFGHQGPNRDESFGPRGPNRNESFGHRGPNRDESFGPWGPNCDESFGPRGPNRDETYGPRGPPSRFEKRSDERAPKRRFDEPRHSGPRFEGAQTRETYPKAFPDGRTDRPDRNFTQKERGFQQCRPERFQDFRGPRDAELTPEQLARKEQNRWVTYCGNATAAILKEVIEGKRPLDGPELKALKRAIRAKVEGINVPRETPIPIIKDEIVRLYRKRYSTAGDTKFFHSVLRDFRNGVERVPADVKPAYDAGPSGNGARPPRQDVPPSRPGPIPNIKQNTKNAAKAAKPTQKSIFKSSLEHQSNEMTIEQPASEETSRITSEITEDKIPPRNLKSTEQDIGDSKVCCSSTSDLNMAVPVSDNAATTRVENCTDEVQSAILKTASKDTTTAATLSWALEESKPKRLTPRGSRGKRGKKNVEENCQLSVELACLINDEPTFSADDVKNIPYHLSIAVIVVPRAELTEKQTSELRNALQAKVFEQLDKDEELVPMFCGIPQHSQGALKLWCADDQTLSWLMKTVETMPSPISETRLVVVLQKDLLVKVGVLVPNCSDTNELMLNYFERQNACYNVRSWVILSRESRGKNTFLTLGIPESELPKIMKRERRLDFGVGSVGIRFFDNGVWSRNPPKDVFWQILEKTEMISIEKGGSDDKTGERSPIAQKQQQKLEYSGQTVYTLEPELEKALEEEIEILGEAVKQECTDPEGAADKVVADHILSVANEDLKKAISVDVKKRVLNITSGLTFRVFFVPRPPKRPVFDEHMRRYGVVSVKKSDRGKFWLIAVNTHKNYDKLYEMGSTVIDGSTVSFKPLHVGGPPAKLGRDAFKQIQKDRINSKIQDYDQEKYVVVDQDFNTDVIESEEPVKEPSRAQEISQKSGVLNETDLNDLLNVNEEDLEDY